MDTASNILKNSHLSITGSRKKILELFINSGGGLAHADIEKQTGEIYDRATVYRTLQTFTDKGLIHLIPTTDNSIRYALCRDNCAEGHHHDNHVHFICTNCKKAICLDGLFVPEITLPKGFKPLQTEMVVKGLCSACK